MKLDGDNEWMHTVNESGPLNAFNEAVAVMVQNQSTQAGTELLEKHGDNATEVPSKLYEDMERLVTTLQTPQEPKSFSH